MTPDEYESAIELLDEMMQQFYSTYRGHRKSRVRDQLAVLKKLCGEENMPFIRVELGVLDRGRQKTTKFGWIDVTYSDDGELFVLGHDTTPRSYDVKGKVVSVPDNQCPKCLSEWHIDLREIRPCPECGCRFGSDIKIVPRGDVCPFCEDERDKGTHRCSCGFDWNADYVAT